MYCNTLVCIAEMRVEIVLQYTSLYCRLGGVVLQDCIAGWEGSVSRYNFCIVTEAAGLG